MCVTTELELGSRAGRRVTDLASMRTLEQGLPMAPVLGGEDPRPFAAALGPC